jgi:predicted nucleic acid-binding protein
MIFDSCVWVGLAAGQVDRTAVITAAGNAPVFTSGVLAAAVKRAGRSPRPRYNDLWIAAQAIEHGYALLTLNAGNFEGLPGLRLATLAPKVQAQA